MRTAAVAVADKDCAYCGDDVGGLTGVIRKVRMCEGLKVAMKRGEDDG